MNGNEISVMPWCMNVSEKHFAAVGEGAGRTVTAEVIHGDAVKVLPDFAHEAFGAAVLDIPYNETDAAWDAEPFPVEQFLVECERVMSEKAVLVVFCSSRQLARVENCLRGFKGADGNRKFLVIDGVWVKLNPFPLRPGVTNCKENFVIAHTRGNDFLQKKRLEAPINAVTSGLVTPGERVWRDDSGAENLHETQKPVELYTKILRRYVAPGSRVLDATSGTGSCGRACLVNGYDSTSIELDRTFYERSCAAFADERIMTACHKRKQVALDNLSLGGGILRKVDRILAGESYITADKRAEIVEKIGKIRGMGLVKNL
jgi:hypothetical protein